MEEVVTRCRNLVAMKKFKLTDAQEVSSDKVKEFLCDGAEMLDKLDEFLSLAKPYATIEKQKAAAPSSSSGGSGTAVKQEETST